MKRKKDIAWERSCKPEVNLRFFFKLFWTTFTLSLFTFGGGFVIISLMRKKMVGQLGWINDEEMLDFVTIAQSSPGPIAVNGSVMVGYHLAGTAGALVATFGTVLPPMIVLTLVSIGYHAVADNRWVAAAFMGMRAVVAAIVMQVTWALFKSLMQARKVLLYILFVLAFIALFVLKINIMVVMLSIIIFSIIHSLITLKKERTL